MSFKTSLNLGQLGETLYFQAHAGELVRLDGRKSDFLFEKTGETIELKCDTYPMEKTPNFFLERFSDKARKTPGGAYQAKLNGSTYFVYLFVTSLTYFTFKTDALVARLDELAPALETRDVRNSSWVTEGFLVPREALMDLAQVGQLVVSKKEKL